MTKKSTKKILRKDLGTLSRFRDGKYEGWNSMPTKAVILCVGLAMITISTGCTTPESAGNTSPQKDTDDRPCFGRGEREGRACTYRKGK